MRRSRGGTKIAERLPGASNVQGRLGRPGGETTIPISGASGNVAQQDGIKGWHA